jgi:purine nucleoside phosphorylase
MTSTARDAAEIIESHNKLGVAGAAIILDHNLYNVAELADNAVSIRYADLPGFPQTPSMQDGELVIGAIEGIATLVLKGCANFHEIGDPSQMAGPIETLSHLGVRSILATGFATSANTDLVPGSLVAITDCHAALKRKNLDSDLSLG